MTRTRVEVEVEAPPEEVWKVVADPRNLPRWDRRIARVTGVPANGLKKGSRYTTEVRFMGIRAPVDAEVLEIDPPREALVRLSGIIDATIHTVVTPQDGGRSRLEHEVDYRFKGGALGAMAAQALRLTGGPALALRRGTNAQKEQVEEG
jgi:uncharacterized protein YndB with AHSA1/START domain